MSFLIDLRKHTITTMKSYAKNQFRLMGWYFRRKKVKEKWRGFYYVRFDRQCIVNEGRSVKCVIKKSFDRLPRHLASQLPLTFAFL